MMRRLVICLLFTINGFSAEPLKDDIAPNDINIGKRKSNERNFSHEVSYLSTGLFIKNSYDQDYVLLD